MGQTAVIWLLLRQLISRPVYTLSTDLTELTIEGVNDEIKREDLLDECSITAIRVVEIKIGITKICSEAFKGATSLESVVLPPSTLKVLETECFFGCSKLKEITITEGVTTIQDKSFYSCECLINITLPSTLRYLTGNIVFGMSYSIERFIFPLPNDYFSSSSDQTILIENNTTARACAYGVKSLTIPSNIAVLQSGFIYGKCKFDCITFSNDTNLKTIKKSAIRYSTFPSMILPRGLTTLESWCFRYTSTTYVWIPATVTSVGDLFTTGMTVEIEENCPAVRKDENGIIYNGAKSIILYVPSNISSITLGKEISNANIQMIRENRNLVELKASSENENFKDYNNGIYDTEFASLKLFPGGRSEIRVHQNCTEFAESALQDSFVTSIIFEGDNVTKFGFKSLQGIKVTNFHFPPNLESMGTDSLYNSAISGSYVMPKSLKNMVSCCFQACKKLTSMDFSNCVNLTVFPYKCFQLCTTLVSIKMPESLTQLDSLCFDQCYCLRDVVIPSSVKSIASNSFSSTKVLTISFDVINSKLTEIPSDAFASSGIRSIRIPNNVRTIQQKGFNNCFNLEEVMFEDESMLSELQNQAFVGSDNLRCIRFGNNLKAVPDEALTELYSLVNISVSKYNDALESVNGVLYLKGGEVLRTFPGGIENFVINGKITKISDYAFFKCKKLNVLQFDPDVNLQSIGSNTFLGCTGLTLLEIPSATKELKEKCFSSCDKLETVRFAPGSRITEIGGGSFTDCSSLVNVEFTGNCSLETIGDSAFAGCRSLIGFQCPPSVKSINMLAFKGCINLSRFDFSAGKASVLEEIHESAFEDCSILSTFSIPATVRLLGSSCFKNCHNLTSVYYCGTLEAGDSCFAGCPQAVAYVFIGYQFQSFGGLITFRIFDSECNIPSLAFTDGNAKRGICVALLGGVIECSEDG